MPWPDECPVAAQAARARGVEAPPGGAPGSRTAAVAALLLVFIGIHNAWDTVMYVTTRPRAGARDEEARASARTSSPPGLPGERQERS